MAKRISLRILIIEDELIIAEAISEMLVEMGHKCVAIADNLEDGQKEIKVKQYDLAILDINLAGNQEGLVLGKLCTALGKPFFFLTSYSDKYTVVNAKQAKPGAYVIKPFVPDEIMVAIEMTLLHQSTEASQIVSRISNDLGLSKREGDVLDCLVDRLSIAEISERLFVSQNTVKFHIKNLYFKLNVGSRVDLLHKVETILAQA